MSKSNTSELHKRILYSILIGDEVPVFIINFHKIAIKQTFFYINRTNKHIPYSLHIYRASSSNHPSRMLHFLWHSLPSSVDPQGDSFCYFLLFELMPAKVNTDIKKKYFVLCLDVQCNVLFSYKPDIHECSYLGIFYMYLWFTAEFSISIYTWTVQTWSVLSSTLFCSWLGQFSPTSTSDFISSFTKLFVSITYI